MPHALTATIPFLLLLLSTSAAVGGHHHHHHHHHDHRTLDKACRATLHRSLCIHSLSSISHPRSARRSPRWWARAALSLATADVRRAASRLPTPQRLARGSRAAASALGDCTELLSDAAQQLSGSLAELRRLKPITFEQQMGDVQTWVSAALTDESTCLDGLAAAAGGGGAGRLAVETREQVLNTTYYTSNALALVNSLASAGGRED